MQIKEMIEKMISLEKEGNKKAVIPLIEQMLGEIEQTKDDALLISVLNIYAGALRDVGELEKSISTLMQAKDMALAFYGEEDVNYATLLSNLANAQRVAREYTQALTNFHVAAEIYKKSDAPKDLMAGAKHNLALLYLEMGELQKGYELQVEELELLKENKEYELAYASALQNMAATLSQMNRIQEAMEHLERSQELITKQMGHESIVLAGVFNTRAFILAKNNELAMAADDFQKALNIVEKHYGTDSQTYASIKSNIDFINEQLAIQK